MLRLSGAFLQLEGANCLESPATWVRRVEAMQALGMDLTIIQYAALDGADWGPAVDMVLAAAGSLGMAVWVGSPFRVEGWWTWQAFSPYLHGREGAIAADAAATVQRWGAHPAFAGLYFPYETNGLADPDAMGQLIGAASQAAKAVRPGTRVMASPFGNLLPGVAVSLPGWWLTGWWDRVLARAGLDVLSYQDGVGGTADQLANVPAELAALGRATSRHGVELWANLEAFRRTTPLWETFAAVPAPFDRLRRQLTAADGRCARAVAFDFSHYLDPGAGPPQEALYRAYQQGFGLA